MSDMRPAILTGSPEIEVHWTVEVSDETMPLLMWTGAFPLTIGGKRYEAVGAIMGVEIGSDDLGGTTGAIATLTAAIVTPELRDIFTELGDPGPRTATLRAVYSTDGGNTWSYAPAAVSGTLSNPRVKDKVYSIDVVKSSIDEERSPVIYMSDEAHRIAHPLDTGFSRLKTMNEREYRMP